MRAKKTFLVGPYKYKLYEGIHPEMRHDDSEGYCDMGCRQIWLRPADQERMLDTEVHEILHAIGDAYGIPALHNEKLVHSLAPALVATLKAANLLKKRRVKK